MSKKQPKTTQSSGKKRFFQKRIPTLVGLGVLVVGLVSGVLLFSQGTGVFAPRATPQSTPKKIKQTNVTDAGFTVSFITDDAVTGFITYGTDATRLRSQASDDRDQLSGSVGEYNVHHITVRGLEPNTTYYYTLGTGSSGFDNNGQPFTVKTAQRTGIPSEANTIYGSVVSEAGNPAEGSVVYVSMEGIGEMSSLVKSSGSWAVPLSNARLIDGSGYAEISENDMLSILVQGTSANLISQVSTTVANAQPVANITLGQSQNLASSQVQQPAQPSTRSANLSNESIATDSGTKTSNASDSAEISDEITVIDSNEATTSSVTRGGLTDLMTADESETVVDLAAAEAASSSPTVRTTQPTIKGKAQPNVTVSIEVHSDAEITQQLVANADGEFELDIAALSQELEPGEHTVVYSYEDPATGQTVTKTQTFYVEDTTSSSTTSTSNQLAQADTGDEDYPYSSSNPYPIDASGSASPSPSPTASSSASATSSATKGGTSSTSSQTSSTSTLPVSGSVGTTYALIIGGLFFILAGAWSWWIANHLEEELA